EQLRVDRRISRRGRWKRRLRADSPDGPGQAAKTKQANDQGSATALHGGLLLRRSFTKKEGVSSPQGHRGTWPAALRRVEAKSARDQARFRTQPCGSSNS